MKDSTKNKKTFSLSNEPKIVFNNDAHSYYGGDKKYTSVTTKWSKYKDEFPLEIALAFSALAHIKGSWIWREYFKKQDEFRNINDFLSIMDGYLTDDFWQIYSDFEHSWDMDKYYGTMFHNDREAEAYENGYIISPFNGEKYDCFEYKKKYDNQSVVDDLFDLPDGAHPELVVWDDESRTSGQIDVPLIKTIDGIRYVSIFDYKSNGGISIEKGKKKRKELISGSKRKRMRDPLSHLWDNKRTDYQGQLSLYARIMEKAGYVVEDLAIGHYLQYDPDTEMVIKLDYLQKEAKLLIG